MLGEEDLPNPALPPSRGSPYYTKAFFLTIKKVQEKSPMNPVLMTVGQWYQYLLEKGVTMDEDDEGRREDKMYRVEELEPGVNWRRSFNVARHKGLSTVQKSFLFKLLHQLLPPDIGVWVVSLSGHPAFNNNAQFEDFTIY